jgi:hypothetical protein
MGFAYQGMSSNGKYQSVIVNTTIYISSDYGKSWGVSDTNTEITDWCSISVSTDGKTQLLCSNSHGVYQSIDYGKTWTQDLSLIESDDTNLKNIDGTDTYWVNAHFFNGGLVACTYNYFYYKYANTTSTTLSIYTITFIFIFIVLLSCAFYFKWFITESTSIESTSIESTSIDQTISNQTTLGQTTTEENTLNPNSKFSSVISSNSIEANKNIISNKAPTTIVGEITHIK